MKGAPHGSKLLIGFVVFWLLGQGSVLAARCGGERPCACGDRVVEDYRLPADLGPCDRSGLRIAAKIRFDGGGRSIRGSGQGGVGLQVGDEGSGSHISALTISGFHHGIRLRGARGVTLSQVEASGNGDPLARTGYGIDFAAAASDNVLERVRVHSNADEGIHIVAGAARNRISDSEVFANGRENVYFLACRDNRLERSRIRDSGRGKASIYIKFSSGTVLEDNTIENGIVPLRGGARDTLLIGNTLERARIRLQAQDDRRFGAGRPANTTVRGGSITAPTLCVRIDDAYATRIEDVAMDCQEGIHVGTGSRVALRMPKSASRLPRIDCVGGPGCFERLPSPRTNGEATDLDEG